MSWMYFLACLTCWWADTTPAQAGGDNSSGISCKWLLVSACSAMAGVICILFAWAKTKDTRIEELHKEKDVVQDARLKDFQDRYDRLSRRGKNKESSGSAL